MVKIRKLTCLQYYYQIYRSYLNFANSIVSFNLEEFLSLALFFFFLKSTGQLFCRMSICFLEFGLAWCFLVIKFELAFLAENPQKDAASFLVYHLGGTGSLISLLWSYYFPPFVINKYPWGGDLRVRDCLISHHIFAYWFYHSLTHNSCLKQLLLRSLLNSEFSRSIIPSTFNTWNSSERKRFPNFSLIHIFIHSSVYICIVM